MADSNGFSPLSEAPAAVRLAAAWAIGMDVTHPAATYRPLEPDAATMANYAPGQRVTWQVVAHDGGNAFLVDDDIAHAAARLAQPDRVAIEDGESIPTTVAAIEPGDWITSRHAWAGMATGRVIRRATVKALGGGFVVRTIRGLTDFLAEADVVIMGYMDCRPPSETAEGEA